MGIMPLILLMNRRTPHDLDLAVYSLAAVGLLTVGDSNLGGEI